VLDLADRRARRRHDRAQGRLPQALQAQDGHADVRGRDERGRDRLPLVDRVQAQAREVSLGTRGAPSPSL
jgi:hypothetical protein